MINHLNCGTFRPFAAPRTNTHCLLVERDQRLLLVDIGSAATPWRTRHVGGIADFPGRPVHVHDADELAALD